MPEKGWELVEKGEQKKEGRRTLGVWENEEKTIMVGAAWDSEIPEMWSLFDLPLPKKELVGVDPPAHWPKGVEVMPEPFVGLKIDFAAHEDDLPGQREHYWIYGEKGGFFLKVFVKKGARFDPKEWDFGRPLPENLEAKKRSVRNAIQLVEKIQIPPTLKIDPNLKPSEGADRKEDQAPKIVVVIRKTGVFEMEGKELGLDGVETVLKDRFRKFGEDEVLHIRADSGVEFKYAQRVIKAGARVGLKKVAFTAFVPDEEK